MTCSKKVTAVLIKRLLCNQSKSNLQALTPLSKQTQHQIVHCLAPLISRSTYKRASQQTVNLFSSKIVIAAPKDETYCAAKKCKQAAVQAFLGTSNLLYSTGLVMSKLQLAAWDIFCYQRIIVLPQLSSTNLSLTCLLIRLLDCLPADKDMC